MGRYLEEPDRALRQEAWELTAPGGVCRKRKNRGPFRATAQVARANRRQRRFPNYLQYAFRARGRFDYTPEDCRKFHEAIEKEIMPVLRSCRRDGAKNWGCRAAAVGPAVDPPTSRRCVPSTRWKPGVPHADIFTNWTPGWRGIFA
jgi:hypothetical protein